MTNSGDEKSGPIKHWTRERLVYHGAMGKVFVAKNVDNGQLFFVKSVASEPVWSKQLEALQNEERILRKLAEKKCPNVVRTVGNATSACVAEMGGKPTMDLFLEFAKLRGNITEVVKRTGKFKETVAKAYTVHILQALACMHRNGIVHRDIKGTNIVLFEGAVKLVGFGRAKDFTTHLTKQSWSEGEQEPEVDSSIRPRSHKSTEQQVSICPPSEIQADISGLGMVVCEMVTGRRPKFDSSLPIEKAIQSLEEAFVKHNMLNCLNFIESCLLSENVVEGNEEGQWTADRLLTHPWIASMDPSGLPDLLSDGETAAGSSLSQDNPTLLLKTDAVTQTATSPRVTSLRKCANKLCCRAIDTDNVIPPLSSRSINGEHKSRKGARLSRLLLF